MMYTYLSPMDVWYGQKELIGKSMSFAPWHRIWHGDQKPEWYKFTFKPLRRVTIGPHAYTIWFDDRHDQLISYDTVCVYTVDLNKS